MSRDVGELLAGLLELGALQYAQTCRRNGYPAHPIVTALLDGAGGRPPAPQVDVGGTLLMTYEEVAAELRISPSKLDRLIRAGTVPVVELDGTPRVRRADLETYIASLEVRSGRAGSGRGAAC